MKKRKIKIITHSKSSIGELEKKAVCRVIKKNFVSEGEEVMKFENEMAKFIGSKHALATSSGTAGLHLALVALEVGKNDEVIIPNYVCRSVLNAVLYCGAKPILCDVDRKTYNIEPEEIRKKITIKTKAVIIAHMFGCPVAMHGLKDIGVPIIEDCAQSIGSGYKDRLVGSFGDFSVFSFEGTKTISTGEGGMILSNSKRLYEKLYKLKEPYAKDKMVKFTYRMSDLQAAVGRVQLKRLPQLIKARQQIAQIYNNQLNLPNVEIPLIPCEVSHTYHRFMIDIKDRDLDLFLSLCGQKGILVKRPIKPYVLNQYLGLPDNKFPNTAYIMKHCASIPIYPMLTETEINRVVKVVRGILLR